MLKKRGFASSILLPNSSFLILGGYDGSIGLTSSDILIGGEFVPGPDLPRDLVAGNGEPSCLCQVNSTHLFMSGGKDGSVKAYLMEISTGSWTRLPDMKVGRDDHVCGVAKGEIVVAGGNTAYLGKCTT